MSDETPVSETPPAAADDEVEQASIGEVFLPHGREIRVAIGLVVGLILYPWLFTTAPVISGLLQGYHPLASLVLIWGIFGIGFDLLLGYTGMLSFGHAIFWGGAAYAAGIFSDRFIGDPLVMLGVGIVIAILLGWLIGFISLRRTGIYFAILTLAFGQMMFYLSASPLGGLTGGENGFTNVNVEPLLGMIDLGTDLPAIAGQFLGTWLYAFIAVVAFVAVLLAYRIVNSPYGIVFKAIRENEQRAEFVGLNVWRYKLMAFIISGAFAGIAGSLFAIHQQYVPLHSLNWGISGEIVIMTVLGGVGSLFGPIFGAGLYLYVENIISGMDQLLVPFTDIVLINGFGDFWHLLLGAVFVVVVWLAPNGLWAWFGDIRSWIVRLVNRVRGGGD
jgi:branched-chain amino acid transport system permease protein